jgi:hypothetical protein
MSEQAVQSSIRLAASHAGCMLWRNQSGACYDETGRLIRYGLANDSAQLNKRIKSSDLIGVTPMLITDKMVGRTVGVFTAIEVKHEGWTHPTNDRERAQAEFIRIVVEKGGLGGFAASVDDLWRILSCV